jgi:hypothetical protein
VKSRATSRAVKQKLYMEIISRARCGTSAPGLAPDAG